MTEDQATSAPSSPDAPTTAPAADTAQAAATIVSPPPGRTATPSPAQPVEPSPMDGPATFGQQVAVRSLDDKLSHRVDAAVKTGEAVTKTSEEKAR